MGNNAPMEEFRTATEQRWCAARCDDALVWPTDNCRRCFIDVALTKLRRTWWKDITDPDMLKFAWCVEDAIGYTAAVSIRGPQ